MTTCSKGWGERCPASTGAKCQCACGGVNHGKNHQKTEVGQQEQAVKTNLVDHVFDYKGYGIHESRCGIKIVRGISSATVILTELPDNPGTSVTNAVEDIATQVYQHLVNDVPPDAIMWVEHYPPRGRIAETFDRVMLQWNPAVKRFQHPQWIHLPGNPLEPVPVKL